MLTSLKIVRKSNYTWVYYPNGSLLGFTVSKGYFTIDEVSSLFQIVEEGKSSRGYVLLGNITLIDSTVGATIETFTTLQELNDRLFALKCPLSNLRLSDLFSTKLVNSSTIFFDETTIYNSFTTPSASNILSNFAGAKQRVVQKFYSNKSVEPTVPAGWIKISGVYTPSVVNIIYAEWALGSRVEYWIIKG